jgi:hypothetical protein
MFLSFHLQPIGTYFLDMPSYLPTNLHGVATQIINFNIEGKTLRHSLRQI